MCSVFFFLHKKQIIERESIIYKAISRRLKWTDEQNKKNAPIKHVKKTVSKLYKIKIAIENRRPRELHIKII